MPAAVALNVPFAQLGAFPWLWTQYREIRHHPVLARAVTPAGSMAELLQRARNRRPGPFDAPPRAVAAAIREKLAPFAPPAAVERNLERLGDGRTVAVVTGQQPVLLGGPGYVLYKALTSIAVAARLSAAGQPAVPIFWNASEDHDWAEANHAHWPQASNMAGPADGAGVGVGAGVSGWRRLRLHQITTGDRAPLSAVRLGADAATINEWLGPGELSASDTDTLASFQTRAMLTWLGEFGLIVVEPEWLRPFAGSLMAAALRQFHELRANLAAEVAALTPWFPAAHEFLQDHPPLFFITGTDTPRPQRRKLTLAADGTVRADGTDEPAGVRDLAAWAEFAQSQPTRFSTNVMLRPLVQNSVLPTVAYCAGPAELNYNALLAGWHERLGVTPAVLLRRFSVSTVGVGDATPAESALEAVAAAMSPANQSAADDADAALLNDLRDTAARLRRDAPTVAAAVAGSIDGMVASAARRLAGARQARMADPLRATANLSAAAVRALKQVWPLPRHLQERTVPVAWLRRQVADVPAWIMALAALDPFADGHWIVEA